MNVMPASIFPTIPGWDGLHPLVVHFPIALLMVAPILVILGLVIPKYRPGFLASAFVLMLLGTIGAYFAVETGEAGAQLVDITGNESLAAAIDHHQALGEDTRLVFTVLTGLMALLLFVPLFVRRPMGKPVALFSIVFLAVYGASLLLLANTASAGGELVHRFGVHAILPPAG